MPTTTITATTDLAPLVGIRVRIERDMPGTGQGAGRGTFYGTFDSLAHSTMMPGFAGGMLLEDPHPGCRGGMTGFAVPYGAQITPVQ